MPQWNHTFPRVPVPKRDKNTRISHARGGAAFVNIGGKVLLLNSAPPQEKSMHEWRARRVIRVIHQFQFEIKKVCFS